MQIKAVIRIASVAACASVVQFSTASAATEKVVYAFKGGRDGASPQAKLLDVKGVLYGTTASGGTSSDGTVFRVTEDGKEKVLHSFQGGSDGYDPTAGLIDVKGTLYGTTSSGVTATGPSALCSSNCGTVFSITPSGTEKALHVFNAGNDGAGPVAALINVKGTLYGTTVVGGAGTCFFSELTCGTVFSITRGGSERVLYTFKTSEGFNPYANLVEMNGTLYGTTLEGSSGPCNDSPVGDVGCGTVFSITPGGIETKLYAFSGGSDGGASYASIIDVNGALYGTSLAGGSGTCTSTQGLWSNSGCGTVFSVTTGGKEKMLYAFEGGSDGAIPTAGLIDVNGTLYGTTSQGGASNDGTVFSVDPKTGKEKVLYSFKGGSDGASPYAGLIDVNGTLYGTTSAGGNGYGTVFSIMP